VRHHGRVSVITDALLVTSSGDRDGIACVNAWLMEHDQGRQQFYPISLDGAGGSKVSCVDLYAACFNHVDVYGLADAISAAPWQIPSRVVAYFNDEFADTFVMSPGRSGRWATRNDSPAKHS